MRKTVKSLFGVIGILLLLSGCGVKNTPEQRMTESVQSSTPETPITSPSTVPEIPTTAPSTAPTAPTQPLPTQPKPEPEQVYTVCIDAGHQQRAIYEQEPIGPGAAEMKAKLSSGTQGVATGKEEYRLNLEVALLLEQELTRRGYRVVMIRTDHDCPLSNAQRAQIANECGADLFIRIHANGDENPNVNGMLCCAPTPNNPYLSSSVIGDSIRLSEIMVEQFCQATGAKNRGIYYVDTMTGINWCQVPATIVEMGYMSNPEEDRIMSTPEYQGKMVTGMANGIDAYFETEESNSAS